MIMVSIFLAPVSVIFSTKNLALRTQINNVIAQEIYGGENDTLEEGLPPNWDFQCKFVTGLAEAIINGNAFTRVGWLPKVNFGGGLGGCIAEGLYYLWVATAFVARLAGGFLDYFVHYSIDDKSFTNTFVTSGWRTVRDITNVFFIVALLYVALKTILSLGGSDSKKMVAKIIVVALLINFSLFTTRVVIDTSNIIAKIFYNSITPINKNGGPALQTSGEKSISVGMVAKYNPHKIVGMDTYKLNGGVGLFIFVTLILMALTLYTAYIFIVVAIVFVSRVVALWLAMIFSPIAFVSHTVNFNIPGFGWDDWFKELMKNAFLAPIFVFFLYLIVLFLDKVQTLAYDDTSTVLSTMMASIIPFTILYILLTKAKDIAISMSGEIGKGMTSAVKLIGGVAGGAALGMAAFGGRAVFGQIGSAIANNSKMKSWAAKSKIGSAFQKGAMKMESGSFDLRQVKIAGKGLGSLTGMDLGDGKKGGFKQAREDRVKRRQHRAEELKVGEDEELNQNVRRAEVAIAEAKAAAAPRLLQLNEGELDQNGHPVNGIAGQGLGQLEREATRTERVLSDAERNLKDVIAQFGATSQAANTARTRQAIAIAGRDTARTNVNDRQALIRAIGANTHHAQVDLQMAQNAVIAEDRTRLNHFADRNNSVTSNVFTVLTGGSWKANREASNKIRASAKQESSTAHH